MIKTVIRNILAKLIGPSSRIIYTSDGFPGKLVGKPTQIGEFTVIGYGGGITLGEDVWIGYGCVLISASTMVGVGEEKPILKPIHIGNRVRIGANVTVLPGVTIGDNTSIGAGSVVSRDIPSNCVAVGVPAKVIKWKTESSTEQTIVD